MRKRLDVLIVNYGSPATLDRCLTSVRTHLPDEQVRVWDNRSGVSDQVRELATGYPEIDWSFSEEGIGYAAGMNRLVARTDEDTFSLNPDAQLTGPLTRTREVLYADRVAAVSPAVVDPSGATERWDIAHRRQTAGRVLLNHAGYAHTLRRTPFSDLYPAPPTEVGGYLTGCSLLVRREAWEDVGLLDERFFVYGEDPEWQARAQRAGWKIMFCDEPDVRHGHEPEPADPPAVDLAAADTVVAAADTVAAAADTVADAAEDAGVGTPATPRPPAPRMRDLRAGNTAVALGMGGGNGSAVIVGDLLLARVQRSKRRSRAALREWRAEQAAGRRDVVLTSPTLETGAERTVALANALAERGHAVTVVCTEAFGPLQRRLSPPIRLLLRPWWVPVVEPVSAEAVLVAGHTPAERRLAAGWKRLGAGQRRAVIGSDDLAGA